RGFFLGESRRSSRRLRLKSNRLRRFRAEPFLFPRGELSDLHLELGTSKSAATTHWSPTCGKVGLPQTPQRRSLRGAADFFRTFECSDLPSGNRVAISGFVPAKLLTYLASTR